MRKDAALQIFAKGLADIGLWRMVVTLPVTPELIAALLVQGWCRLGQLVVEMRQAVRANAARVEPSVWTGWQACGLR